MLSFHHRDIPAAANEFLRSKEEFNRKLESLMEIYLKEDYEVYDDADDKLQYIREKCIQLNHGRDVSIRVSEKNLLIYISYSTVEFTFTAENLAILKELQEISPCVQILSIEDNVTFTVDVPYYRADQETPYMKAFNAMMKNEK